MDGQKKTLLLLFTAAAALRLGLFVIFPGLAELLLGRVEVSTPVTSFKRLQEGVYLFNQGISPYDGGVYHQSPLLLAPFAILSQLASPQLPTLVTYIIADLISARAIVKLAETGQAVSTRYFTSPRKDLRWSALGVGAAFLFNPFTVAACLGRSSAVFTNCALLQATAAAATGNLLGTIYGLSLASYMSLYPVLLAPPLAILAFDCAVKSDSHSSNASVFFLKFTAALTTAISVLLSLSWFLMDFSWTFLASSYRVQLLLVDLTPNIGLWWYFFIEMFDSFREFFLGVFWLHMASYVGAMTIRIRKQPIFVITSLLGIFAIFKPYPSVADIAIYLGLLPLYGHIIPLLRYGFIAAAALLYASFLGPAFWHLWVYAGSGNANFFYAITLVWSLGLTIVVADTTFAVLRDEFEAERPELRGKDVRQI